VVKKWIEDQSWKTEYVCLNVPEPLKLPNREEVEKHFRQTHLASIIKPTESHEITGTASRSMPCRALQRLVRVKWEEQKRFPLQIATVLSQQFASRGLQFFKKDKTVTHVAVARPHYLDIESTPVSDNVKRLLDFINAHPKCSRRQLFEAIAPSALATMRQPAEGAAAAELTPEASALIADLHWLVHQGHVVEFANGLMETAKKPAPRPPKPEPAKKAEKAAVVGPASQTSMPATEAAPGSVEFVQPPNAVPGNDPAPVETAEQIQVATGAAERGETLPPNPGVSEAAPTDDKQA
jgi:hypothetical protein